MNDSPSAILFDTSGIELAVTGSQQIPSGSRGIISVGVDENGVLRFIRTDTTGSQIFVGSGASGSISIQGIPGGVPVTISGSIAATNPSVGSSFATAPTSATLFAGIDDATGFLEPVQVGEDGHLGIAGNSLAGYAGEVRGWNTSTHQSPAVDAAGALYVRGQVMTDEGSFIDDFPGTTLSVTLSGTLDFTSGSTLVTGTGTAFLSQLDYYSFIKKSADAETLWVGIDSVESDTSLTLSEPYGGTTQSGQTAVESYWKTTTGAGGSISVASSIVTIAAGTTNGSRTGIRTIVDYLPYLGTAKLAVSQRIANQQIFVGYFDNLAAPAVQAGFLFDGATNTTVKCVSGPAGNAASTQTTTVTLPGGVNSSAQNTYQVVPLQGQVAFYVNAYLVAVHNQHVVPPYAEISFGVYTLNQAAVTATTVTLDSVIFESIDRLDARVYCTNPDFMQVTVSGKTTTGVAFPIQVSAAGIVTISGAVTLTGTSNTVRGNNTMHTTDAVAAVANSLPVISQLVATKLGATTVDRLIAAPTNQDAEAVELSGSLVTKTRLYGFNNTSWDRIRSTGTNSDGTVVIPSGSLYTDSHLRVFNGTTWDRQRGTIANGLLVDVSRVSGSVNVLDTGSSVSDVTSVTAVTSSVNLLAANTNRIGGMVFNDSTSVCYLKLGATASSGSFSVRMGANSYYDLPNFWRGIVSAAWVTATGAARVTEITI